MISTNISDFPCQNLMEKIEDEYDLKSFETAMRQFYTDPETYTLAEVEKELGLS